MRNLDLVQEAFKNTRRNKTRTALTVVAVFIGAFTLTLTNSIGTGVSSYIGAQLDQIGNDGALSVTKPDPDAEKIDMSKPQPYQETNATKEEAQLANATTGMGFGVGMLDDEDIEALRNFDSVKQVEPTILAHPKYVMGSNNEKWLVTPNIASGVMTPDLIAGEPFTVDTDMNEIIIPEMFVESLGYSSSSEIIGETVTFAADSVLGEELTTEATVVGVTNKSLFGDAISMNTAVSSDIINLMKSGLPNDVVTPNSYISAIVYLDDDLTQEEVDDVISSLVDSGFDPKTIKDQLGSIQAVIDGIVGVLNGFAIIALIAAGFGIVNTLLMSVQERTREIGLMKAMGMASSKIYGLFSVEAVLIGLIGTVIGVAAAIGVGMGINTILSDTLLAELPGLVISLFTVSDILTVFGLVLGISFVAGTIPSMKAAQQSPIDALRYE